MSDQADDRVVLLEQQMQDLMRMLEEERERRREEKQSSDTKVRLLESKLQENENKPKQSKVPRVASLPQKKPTVHRDVAVSTPRTSDNLFAAQPSGKTERPPRLQKGAGKSSAASADGSFAANDEDGNASPSKSGTTGGGAGQTAGGAGGAADGSSKPPKETALQHSWDKFCYIARNQFTPQELSLVSAETLRALLDHYRIRAPVERAQIEAQWALLQEGKETVGGAATPRNIRPNTRNPIKQASHGSDFEVEIKRAKPHLSKRLAINAEPKKGSNPNETTSRSGFVRTASATRLLTPRSCAPANPNDVATHSTPRRYCFAAAEKASPRSETPRGMRHVDGPTSGERTPRGIRSEGSTHHGPDRPKTSAIRTNIDQAHGGEAAAGARRGLRTFAQPGSPVREHRPSRVCSTPPHLQRQRLGTETLHSGSGNWSRARPNQHVSRAPFATD